MVTDQEPRYRFRDSSGNITGTVFERGGELVVQEGTSGDENELVLQSDGTVQAKRLAGGYLYAGAFDGGDADARLDNALAAANAGETILLENANYTKDRTISATLNLTSLEGAITKGARIDATWSLNGNGVSISGVRIDQDSSDGFVVNDNFCKIGGGVHTAGSTIQVNANNARIVSMVNSTVTFASGTSGGIVDSSSSISVTDNGSNTVGDIA